MAGGSATVGLDLVQHDAIGNTNSLDDNLIGWMLKIKSGVPANGSLWLYVFSDRAWGEVHRLYAELI